MNEFLALSLDEEIVLLHPDREQLIVLDPWARQVWQLCEGHTTDELIRLTGAPSTQVEETLRTLTATGVIRCEQDRWIREQTRWV